jgi:hypothetical protein
MLSTSLLGLANVMLILSLDLGLAVASETCNRATNSTRDAVSNTTAVVIELSSGLLTLSLGILLLTFSLQVLLKYQQNEYVKNDLMNKGVMGYDRTSEPTKFPTNSFPEPILWFQLPSWRLGSSFVIAPLEEAEYPPSFAVAWEASFSSSAFCFLASPAFLSPAEPVTLPRAD